MKLKIAHDIVHLFDNKEKKEHQTVERDINKVMIQECYVQWIEKALSAHYIVHYTKSCALR